MESPGKSRLYLPEFEKDSCGFGLIANMDDEPSHWLIRTSIQSLSRLTHRGAIGADGRTGDGCGILFKMPQAYMRDKAGQAGFTVGELFAVGSVFLSTDSKAEREKAVLEEKLSAKGLRCAGWRTVPVNPEVCGEEALRGLPRIEQIFIDAGGINRDDFERRLFVGRRRAELALVEHQAFHIASLSSRTLSYKGLMLPEYLTDFYQDLQDEKLESSLCVFHQRFSTNTLPQWKLAQPFRFLAHNGEINTIRGNRNWALARAHVLAHPDLPELNTLSPLVSLDGSDSAALDNMLEVLLAGGLDIFYAMRMLIPPAWQNISHFDPDLRAFYEYSSLHMEPWDGPAGIVLTDGRYAACVMDRNGLRPARYVITKDRHITLASEIGVYDYKPGDVVSKGRLKPGEMIAADTQTGKLLCSEDIDTMLKSRRPYQQWIEKNLIRVGAPLETDDRTPARMSQQQLAVYEKMFNVSFEEKEQVIKVLADVGQEAIGSMGDDTPMPVLSAQIRPLFDNFRQLFAQVTNPPIDSLREQIVMSLETYLGERLNPFADLREQIRIMIDSPVLSERGFMSLLKVCDEVYPYTTISLNRDPQLDLENSLEQICDEALKAVCDSKTPLLILSDRDISPDKIPVHALLACGAVHHRLIAEGVRCRCNIIVETGTVRDPHHFAVLIGYGASAVVPYLAYELLNDMFRSSPVPDETSPDVIRANYRSGINKGLYKIISKMGIATIASYRGSQLFEIIGLHEAVVEKCFKGTVSRIQGIRFEDLEQDQSHLAWRAWNRQSSVPHGGLLKYIHGGEFHAYNPEVVKFLHQAVSSGSYEDYKRFSDCVNQRPVAVLRDLLRLKPDRPAIALSEVEAEEEILKRFDSAGMSLGALSPDAHETLAQAMNRIGGCSNSGEGGEDPARYNTDKSSKIKQVASGRFGVTPYYLVNAQVLQIKIAQGAKPGEGGQLPGHKVNKMIARLRYANEGVALISPPPHHDIYSIEDLAQLIFDLKQINPEALVSVKLVAEAGVGTIAAGVVKAHADLITISGYDGGTGASPLTSIKYAGSPWELGLTETHTVLRQNNLRGRVRLQTDGGLKTGLDVIKAALLGAESFAFGTAPMIAMGCKYLRICHLNNCATGVATQNQILRERHFIGKVDMVVNYFRFVAREVREIMAELGIRRFDDLIGHSELLEIIDRDEPKQKSLDLSPILSNAELDSDSPQFCIQSNEPVFKSELAIRMFADMRAAVRNQSGGEFHYEINNTDRSVGANISGEIARHHGNNGMKDAPVKVCLTGTAGQSFGVWNAGGLVLELEGDANDYVGKGMAGGMLVIRPPEILRSRDNRNMVIIGNTCLYGATGGRLFAAGTAGERFAVRNSGAIAVVEGIGDHGCEYMTGGVVVVLGKTGRNFGAGMTGGFAFALDLDNTFSDLHNHSLIEICRIDVEGMVAQQDYLRRLIQVHMEKTDSVWAAQVLDDFAHYIPMFWLVKPKAAELNTLISSLRSAA